MKRATYLFWRIRGFWWFLGREGDSAPGYRNRMGIRRSWKLGEVFTIHY